MNPLILIPARMAATRLPDKPLADIGGTPMIVRAWRQAVLSGLPVAVAAGDQAIVDAIESAGGVAVLTDPDLPSGSDRIRAAVQPIRDTLAALPENRRWLVTSEGAFSYLARDLGMKELYLWPINADQTGTPQQVRAVIDGVTENKIPVVFCESTVSSAPAEQVARETGAQFGGVLYVDSLSAEDGPVPSYLDLLKVTSETIVDGLTGGSN